MFNNKKLMDKLYKLEKSHNDKIDNIDTFCNQLCDYLGIDWEKKREVIQHPWFGEQIKTRFSFSKKLKAKKNK